MNTPRRAIIVILLGGLLVIASPSLAQETDHAEREAMYYRYLEFPSYVKGGSVEPHWMADGNSFWYAEGDSENTVIYKVDPMGNTKIVLFDTARLREMLTPLLGHAPPHKGLPFKEFTFVDKDEKAARFTVEEEDFILDLDSYSLSQVAAESESDDQLVPQVVGNTPPWFTLTEVLSPDGRWFASLRDHNLWLRSTDGGSSVQITTDGIQDYQWGHRQQREPSWAWWSPDSQRLTVKKVDYRNVPKKLFAHLLGPTEEAEWMPYPQAGGPMPQIELFIIDIQSKSKLRVNIGDVSDLYIDIIGWRPDGSELLFIRVSRDYKRLDLMAVDPTNGVTRVLLTETTDTALWIGFVGGWGSFLTLLKDGSFIWESPGGDWDHLYLYDAKGTLIRRLTEGEFDAWVVAVNEETGWVYFAASGDRKRPYDFHLYRVNLEGGGLQQLTEAIGDHDVRFAPSYEFFLDTHSSVDRPPTVEVRSADGILLQTLSQASIDRLREVGWTPPEEFVVKAADGETDLYGILYKPYDFDSNKKYPVIELTYPVVVVPRTFVPLDWAGALRAQALAQLGFVVFMVDGRGSGMRGKKFQDVIYRNWGRHEIPDHVAALRQVAETRRYMDLSRVGIFGHSWGGYFTIRALLLAPDLYRVGVASAPLIDVRCCARAHEPWMGLPQNNRDGYEYASNLPLAGNLEGQLLLITGTNDVLFSEAMKMVDALIQAGKPYDLMVLPEQGHGYRGMARAYVREAIRRYFQKHLKPEKVVLQSEE